MTMAVGTDNANQANRHAFDHDRVDVYAEGAPHLQSASIRGRLELIMDDVSALVRPGRLHILDLGAGEGSVTASWLKRGHQVTAVDLSGDMLRALARQCRTGPGQLEIVEADASAYLADCRQTFDVVSCVSFLHHVPDYLSLLEAAVGVLRHPGCLVTFADPLRYDSVRVWERLLRAAGYAVWRLSRPDRLGAVGRSLRRATGSYLPDSQYDNAEYHVTRNGVDQELIGRMLKAQGLSVTVVPYFSSQSRLFTSIGQRLGAVSEFGLIGVRP